MKSFFTKERIRAIISFVFAFFVSLGIFCSALSVGILYFIKENNLTTCIKNSNYTKLAVECLTEELNELAIPSGLDEDFFNGKIDTAEFENIFYGNLESTLAKSGEYTVNLDNFKNMVETTVREYTEQATTELSDETKKDIVSFADACGSIYLTYINPALLSYALEIFVSVNNYVVMVLFASLVLTVICALLLFKLNHLGAFLQYLFSAFLGASFSLGIIPAFLLLTNEMSKIGITLKSLHAVITALANNFLTVSVVISLVLATISLILVGIKIFGLIFKK
ncbi:MAG: hypothetical protein IIX54_01815 [Clostridia bacterium]|nr:hypothetical protein [Clostridia bacterium]